MKLKKQYAGCYKATAMVDGYKVEVEANESMDFKGFSYEVRVNGQLVSSDGYGGLRLKDIKQMVRYPVNFLEKYLFWY